MKTVLAGLLVVVVPCVCAALVEGQGLASTFALVPTPSRDVDAELVPGAGGVGHGFWSSRRYLASHPRDRQHLRWGDDEAQGVAHDDAYWYFTERAHLTRIPVHADVNVDASSDREVGLPGGCRHFGDPVHSRRDAMLYVPLEGCEAEGRVERRVVVYDASLVVRRTATLVGARHAAWLAVDPRDGTLVGSSDYSSSTLQVYASTFVDGARLVPLSSISLVDRRGAPMAVAKIQGGEFSENGRLYLTSDDPIESRAGVWVFEVVGARATLLTHIGAGGVALCQEVEGITIWDTRDVGAPSIGGEIHWLLHSNRGICGDSNLWFKHLAVSDASLL